jgi:signal transduction histidine kinase
LPPDSERLFQAFYSTKSSGMGIGLSVSHSIIENHRGRLWAESNSGPGATFSFRIPRAPGSERDTQRAGVSILVANAGGAVMSES